MVDIKGTENLSSSTPSPVSVKAHAAVETSQVVAGQGGTVLPQTFKAGAEIASITSSHEPSREQVEQSVAQIADYVQSIQRNLSFSLDENTGRTVLTVTDTETDEVIRQLPSEEVLKLAQKLNELQQQLSHDGKGNFLKVLV